MTMDGHVLWSKHANTPRHVASTIKMLNALVVLDRAKLTDTVVVTKQAQTRNGGVWLGAGQRLTVRQLLDMMLIHSANDAATVLALHVGGTQARFVAMMNAKAASLGLTHTHAVDPDGVSGKEVSTAEDLSVLGRQIMASRVLRPIVGRAWVSVPQWRGKPVKFASTDLLIGHYEGLEGIKTGFTTGAGFCYVAAAKRGGVELLGVVLGAQSESARFSAMRVLLDWGFSHSHVQQVVSRHATRTVEVRSQPVVVYAANAASATVFNEAGPLQERVEMSSHTTTQISQGERLGTLVVSQDAFVLARVPLLSSQSLSSESGMSTAHQTVLGRPGSLFPIVAGAAICIVLVIAGAAVGTLAARRKGLGRSQD